MNDSNELFSISIENVNLYFIIHNESFLQRQNESWEKALHSHIYYEILYSVGGDNRVVIHNNEYQLQSDTFTIVRPYQNHGAFFQGIRDLFSIGFYFERNRNRSERHDLYALLEHCLSKKDYLSIAGDSLRHLFLKLQELIPKKEPISEGLMLSTLVEIVYQILDIIMKQSHDVASMIETTKNHRSYSPRGNTFHALCQVNDTLNAQYMEDITPESMSDKYYISPKQINRYIFNQYGQTFLQRRTSLRMAAAQNLLKNTKETVNHISEAVGYHSINTFYSAFKNFCGMTPDEYRHNSN